MRLRALVLVLVLALALVTGATACVGSGSDGADDPTSGDVGENGPLVGKDDVDEPSTSPSPSAARMRVTEDLNLRAGPRTTFPILAVLPAGVVVDVVDPVPTDGFLAVTFAGTRGYASARYLVPEDPAPPPRVADIDGPASPNNALARAASVVGFSYWWGGGRWRPEGPSASTAGACSGSCPSCSHSGSYGADCSGMVAKAWQFGPKAVDVNAHPYATGDFAHDAEGKWSTIARASIAPGDALVYAASGSGHIVLFEKGDPWGAATVYECKGCAYGCVHGTRTFGAAYHAIRRAGF